MDITQKLDVVLRQILLVQMILVYLVLRSPSMRRSEKIAAGLIMAGAIFGTLMSRL